MPFLSKPEYLDLSLTFKDFRDWLLELHTSFACGIQTLDQHDSQQMMHRTPKKVEDEVSSIAFDEETLGGHVTSFALIRPSQQLTGALKRLAIRCDPAPHLPPSSTGAVQADA